MNPKLLGLFIVSLILQTVKCQNLAGLMTFFDGISSGNSGKCPYQPHESIKTKYMQHSNFRVIPRDCAPGTEYDHSKCSCVNARSPQRGSNPRINNINPAVAALSPPAGIQDIMSELFRRFQNQPGGGVNDVPAPVVSRPNPPSRGALPSLIKPQSRSPTNQMEQVRRIIRTRPTDSQTLPEQKTTTTAPPPPPIVPTTQLVRKKVRKTVKTGSRVKKNRNKKKKPKARLVINSNKVQPGPPYNPTPKDNTNTKQDAAPNTFIEFVKSQITPNTETKHTISTLSQTKPVAGVPNVLDNLLTQGPPPDLSKLLQKGPTQDAANLLQQGLSPDIAKLLQQGPPPDIAKLLQQGPPPDIAKLLQQGSPDIAKLNQQGPPSDLSKLLQKGPAKDTANLLQQGPPPDIAKLLQQSPPLDFAKLLQQGLPPELEKLLQQGPPPDIAKLLQQGPPPDISKLLQKGSPPDISKLLQQGPPPELAKLSKQSQVLDVPNILKQGPLQASANKQQQSRTSNVSNKSNKGLPVNFKNVMQQAPPFKNSMGQDQTSAFNNLLQQPSQPGNTMGNSGGPVLGPTTDPLSALMALMSSMKQPEVNVPQPPSPATNYPTVNNNNNNNMEQLPANLDQAGNLPLASFMANMRRPNSGRSLGGSSSGGRMGGMNPLLGGSGRGSSGPFGNLGSNLGASGLGAMSGGGGGGADLAALLAGMGGASSGSSGLGGLAGLNLGSLGGATGALAAGSRSNSPPDLTNIFNMQGGMTPLNMAELANVNHVLLNQMDRQGLVDVSDLTPAGLIAASKHFSRAGGATAALLG